MLLFFGRGLMRECKDVIRKIDLASVPRCPVPRPFAVKDVGATTGGIQGTAHQVNQEVIAGRSFQSPIDLIVEQVLREHPKRTADGSRHQIDLPDSSYTMFVAGKRSVMVPGAARDVYSAVFLDRHFA